MNDPLKPSPQLLCKLGSIIVHADELMSPSGHSFDKHALASVLGDPEVAAWLKAMDDLALIPKKR